jgi:hypothetical protein
MKAYSDILERARLFAAGILPNPEDLAPETPAGFVGYVEAEAAKIGESLGDLSDDELEAAGGLDAWRALVVRCVTEIEAVR